MGIGKMRLTKWSSSCKERKFKGSEEKGENVTTKKLRIRYGTCICGRYYMHSAQVSLIAGRFSTETTALADFFIPSVFWKVRLIFIWSSPPPWPSPSRFIKRVVLMVDVSLAMAAIPDNVADSIILLNCSCNSTTLERVISGDGNRSDDLEVSKIILHR